ncbi:hypothetical protein LEP1GSC202_0281 [Leptospira yanagawae serovar Saopaulo str. Sao Paulo = ATCC 700523]|uniref:Uncharacterized protein n=1 Tax=Leptospira yanagawae serovar Saopaulo str. Sao Paulo = ATCC 700523 TaxID=1249483 RepID=A0A5E8H8D3_9LEPT|nr:hypothetical protein LEP1GSC202_0281 [Leptospira yanagawae serovar Saopaulo str. Sao Paulo = ATCC 700523]
MVSLSSTTKIFAATLEFTMQKACVTKFFWQGFFETLGFSTSLNEKDYPH